MLVTKKPIDKEKEKVVEDPTLKELCSKLDSLITLLSKESPKTSEGGKHDRALLLDISKTLSIFLESQLQLTQTINEQSIGINSSLKGIIVPDNKELLTVITEHNKLLRQNLSKSYHFDVQRNEDGISKVIVTPKQHTNA